MYTSLSAFNIIHLSCHLDAVKADRALKPPKSEWEGAMLRNSRASCNSLLPLYNPTVHKMSFLGAVERHFGTVSSFGDQSMSRFGQIMHDIRLLMLRIAYKETLWDDTGGGSLSSNLKLLPYQLQLGFFLAREVSSSDGSYELTHYSNILERGTDVSQAKAASGFQGEDGPRAEDISDESIPFLMVLGLIFWTQNEWDEKKAFLLLKALKQCRREARNGTTVGSGAATVTRKRSRSNSFSSPSGLLSSSSSSATLPVSSEKRQKRSDVKISEISTQMNEEARSTLPDFYRPMLRFACIINSIQRNLKNITISSSSSSSSSSASVAMSSPTLSSASSFPDNSSKFDPGLTHDDDVIIKWCEKFVPSLEGELSVGSIGSYLQAFGLGGSSAIEIEKFVCETS